MPLTEMGPELPTTSTNTINTSTTRPMSMRLQPPRSNFHMSAEGLSLDDVDTSTAILSARVHFKETPCHPVIQPIYHSSTYYAENVEDFSGVAASGGFVYSRVGNPTTETVDATINAIERGAGSLTFSSGVSAISAVCLAFLSSGDHVVYQIPCYPGLSKVLRHMQDNFGIQVTSVKNITVDKLVNVIEPNTKMIWLETPCNPEISVVDVEQVAKLTRDKNILLCVDGSLGTPYLQHLMAYGVDFSMHSCSKYMGGHSDLIGGCVTTRTVEQWRVLKAFQGTLGNMLSPHDASLLLRGLKTLPLRMDRISNTALKVATYLEQHPKVQLVRYPGLPSHPDHDIAKRQMPRGCSGMILVEVKGGDKAAKIVAKSLRLFLIAPSLGGVESLIEHPFCMSHAPHMFPEPEESKACDITPGMLRVSIGIEEPQDLIKDFEQALEKIDL